MEVDVRYVRSGGVSIAYQVVGDAETDLVFVPDFCSNLVYGWESEYWRPFYERLARSFRLILFDKRGTGLSDRGGGFPTLETRMEDVRAVLDAVGSSRTVIFGSHEGCLMAALFAATYPESSIALALFHPSMPGYLDPAELEELPKIRERWGTKELCDQICVQTCPTLAATAEGRSWFANWLRVGAGPAMGYELNRAFMETDMADVVRRGARAHGGALPRYAARQRGVGRRGSCDPGSEQGVRVRPGLLGRLPVPRHCGRDRAAGGRRAHPADSRKCPHHPALHRHRRLQPHRHGDGRP
jgi:pimeloyl-ACP methyl ester carboxylesterase